MSIELQLHRDVTADSAPERALTTATWEIGPGWRGISSAMLGGGIGTIGWVINAQVPGDYSRTDPVEHLGELADQHGMRGRGVGMLTAAPVANSFQATDSGVSASATVGLRVPTWAAAAAEVPDPELAPMVLPDETAKAPYRPGTINITVQVPVALTDAALVNAVITVTEAKTQALLEAGYPATGTASDAVVIVVPEVGEPEVFAGPRSQWGSAVARAVHAVVLAGAHDYTGSLPTSK
ncbi:adenosylcobinamide amidohydrolase [Gordonia sp. (in: high G+C Gram-positive bacteria)]|uniref:adenosylcobinamide amidohydrolase n=2 Tax=Gordonia sp. (in: high G+C Gram-positive bacteria) TaxID=84139 RepID=UPI003C7524BA